MSNLFGSNLFACIVLAVMRLSGVASVRFQAVAHCYVGGLFVYGWMVRKQTKSFIRLAWAISLLELYAGLKSHGLLPF